MRKQTISPINKKKALLLLEKVIIINNITERLVKIKYKYMIGLLPIKEGSAYFRVDKSILSAAVINNFKKTKILYLITKGNWGGAQRYVFDLATNLPKNEWDVVVVHGKGEILAEKLKKNEIRTIQLKNSQRDINPFKDLLLFFELLGLYKREKPDVVHLNSSKIGFLGALTALIYKLSTIN